MNHFRNKMYPVSLTKNPAKIRYISLMNSGEELIKQSVLTTVFTNYSLLVIKLTMLDLFVAYQSS